MADENETPVKKTPDGIFFHNDEVGALQRIVRKPSSCFLIAREENRKEALVFLFSQTEPEKRALLQTAMRFVQEQLKAMGSKTDVIQFSSKAEMEKAIAQLQKIGLPVTETPE